MKKAICVMVLALVVGSIALGGCKKKESKPAVAVPAIPAAKK